MGNWNEPVEDEHDGPGETVEIIQDAPHLDDDAERALRPQTVTGQRGRLPKRNK